MNVAKRREVIMEYLEEAHQVYISDLAEKLAVSAMTVRRDLSYFAEQGLVTLAHGGAVLNRGAAFEYSRRFRKSRQPQEKRRIAAYCADLVPEGSSVFIDSGSTPEEIAEALIFKKNIVVLTHSLPAANVLSAAKDLKLIMAPGEFAAKPQNFVGQMTSEFVRRFKIDILFLGGDGIDLAHGATNPHIADSVTKRTLVEQAERVVFAVDHTKIGCSSFMTIASLKEIDLIVTDREADPVKIEELRAAGVNIVLV